MFMSEFDRYVSDAMHKDHKFTSGDSIGHLALQTDFNFLIHRQTPILRHICIIFNFLEPTAKLWWLTFKSRYSRNGHNIPIIIFYRNSCNRSHLILQLHNFLNFIIKFIAAITNLMLYIQINSTHMILITSLQPREWFTQPNQMLIAL